MQIKAKKTLRKVRKFMKESQAAASKQHTERDLLAKKKVKVKDNITLSISSIDSREF